MLYLASDHAGFQLKEKLKSYLNKLEIRYQDLGPKKLDPKDDYPDFAFKVAFKVAINPDKNQGILICKTGQGMMKAANKIKGIRAYLAWDKLTAKQAKTHLNANILTLGGETVSFKKAKKILYIWLSSKFSEKECYKKRLRKIEQK